MSGNTRMVEAIGLVNPDHNLTHVETGEFDVAFTFADPELTLDALGPEWKRARAQTVLESGDGGAACAHATKEVWHVSIGSPRTEGVWGFDERRTFAFFVHKAFQEMYSGKRVLFVDPFGLNRGAALAKSSCALASIPASHIQRPYDPEMRKLYTVLETMDVKKMKELRTGLLCPLCWTSEAFDDAFDSQESPLTLEQMADSTAAFEAAWRKLITLFSEMDDIPNRSRKRARDSTEFATQSLSAVREGRTQ